MSRSDKEKILIDALIAARCPCWVHNAAITNDIEALRKIALWHCDWNNNVRVAVLSHEDACK